MRRLPVLEIELELEIKRPRRLRRGGRRVSDVPRGSGGAGVDQPMPALFNSTTTAHVTKRFPEADKPGAR
ncbi:hypothetical protein [Burkholderia cepacia]|uniref:hypothetical protein n=1 Tax=Burkholderia cepacia TaxID=292 RepID=UPI0015897198|nr:hypothetical protein [Burkholderia cepacia]